MAEIVDLPLGDIGARPRQRPLRLPRQLDWKHPVERPMHDVDRQPAHPFRIGHLRQQRMECGRHRRQVRERRVPLEPGHIA